MKKRIKRRSIKKEVVTISDSYADIKCIEGDGVATVYSLLNDNLVDPKIILD